ncbi:MAG: hypothetical protein ICV66_00480 [Chitinophagaceae bacterium]|nr:hypothetical protein [Chitinophagaceae bacterium]
MKKSIVLFVAIFFIANSFASNTVELPKLKASQILIPIGKTGQQISLLDLSTINIQDFQKITGEKMKFVQKVSFMIAQKNLRNTINEDGTLRKGKIEKFFRDCESGFHLGGFALGFLLGIIGVVIAYLIKDDCKDNRVKWAWIAFGVQAVIGLISILAL